MININIYLDAPSSSLEIERVILFLQSMNLKTELKGSISDIDSFNNLNFNEYLESIKIWDIESPLDHRRGPGELPPPGTEMVRDNFIDGYWLQRKLYSLLKEHSPGDFGGNCLNIVLTGKLFGTFGTRRYHARVLLTGEPCILSTSGIVEAPARPREYYFAKASFMAEGRDISELDELFKGSFVDYDSPKITDITCSYILQLVKYSYTGEPFCPDDGCCLHNSHWQEQVLELQYNKKICGDCRDILKA